MQFYLCYLSLLWSKGLILISICGFWEWSINNQFIDNIVLVCCCSWQVITLYQCKLSSTTPATSPMQSTTWRKGLARSLLSYTFKSNNRDGEFHLHFTKINKLSPSNGGYCSMNFLTIFQFSCLPTVGNLHLHYHVTHHRHQ